MSMNPIHNRMQQSWQLLRQQWQKVGSLWRDEKYLQFEHEFWHPLESQMPSTLIELERMAQLIAQARQSVR